jgi:MFS family permease
LLTITMNSLFSKILGPIRQGKQQGILQASSALARMIGPLTTSALYSGFGPRPVWLLQMLVILLTLGAWITAYKRMIPMIVDKDSKNNKVHPV